MTGARGTGRSVAVRRLDQSTAIRPSIGVSPTAGSPAVVRRPRGATNLGQTGIRGGVLNFGKSGSTRQPRAIRSGERSLARVGDGAAGSGRAYHGSHSIARHHLAGSHYGYGDGYGYGYGDGYGDGGGYGYGYDGLPFAPWQHHYSLAIGAGFGYYPYYPYYPYGFYDPFYAAYYPAYGPTVVHQETVVQESPVIVEGYPSGAIRGEVVAGAGPEDTAAPSGGQPAAATIQEPASQTQAPQPPPPDSMEDLLMRGDYAFAQGRYAEARAMYMQASVVDGESPHPRFAYALAGFALGDYKIAANALRRAMRLFPDLARSEADLRAAYRVPGDFQRHLNRLTEYTHANDKDADAWLLLGYIQYFTGARAAALTSLAKSLELNPNDTVSRAFFDAARAVLSQPPPSAAFPPVDEKAPPAAQPAAPKAGSPPAGAAPSAASQSAAPAPVTTPRTADAPSPPVVGSEPGVSVEFAPPGASGQSAG